MIGFLRNWIISVTAAAIVSAVALAVTPQSRSKKATSLACGLLMITVLVGPVLKLDMESFAGYTAAFRYEAGRYIENLENTNEKLTGLMIRAQTEAYILDKARALKIEEARAVVTVREGEDGMICPYAVELGGNATEDAKHELSRCIEADLAIPVERQRWS